MTKIPDNIKLLSGCEIGNKLLKQEICPVELINYYLDNIINYKDLSPFIEVFRTEAIKNAEKSKERIKNRNPLSPWDGVPIAWKDLFDISGYKTMGGSKLLKDSAVALKDAVTVRRSKQRGLIPIGKTRTVEFALGGLGTNKYLGTPVNTIMKDKPRVPGGSSSGSATALARDMCAASIGTDTGGSVRIPAAWNKLVGLKTSFGHLSTKGVLPLAKSLDTVGPLTKSVEDAHFLYSILSGKSDKNSKKFIAHNSKILVSRGMPFGSLDHEVDKFTELIISKLSSAGINITEEIIPEIEEMYDILNEYGTVVTAEAWNQWKHLIIGNEDQVDNNVLNRMLKGKDMPAIYIKKIKAKQKILSKKLYEKLSQYDVMLMPTTPILPPKISDVEYDQHAYNKYNTLALRNTSIGNILPMCAITLPYYKNNLPIGIMLYKPIGEDYSLLKVAKEYNKIINS